MTKSPQTDTPPAEARAPLALLAPALVVAACTGGGSGARQVGRASTGTIRILGEGERPERSEIAMPQLQFGPDSAPQLMEVAYSLHCGGSRQWFLQEFPRVARACKAGRTQLMLSHLPRTANELAAGIELMSVGEKAYPDATLATVAFMLSENRSMSAAEIAAFLPAAGFPLSSSSGQREAYGIALRMMRALYESAGATSTPYVRIGAKT